MSASPRTGLDENLVAVADELVGAGGRAGDPVLVVLDLGGDPDLQCIRLLVTNTV